MGTGPDRKLYIPMVGFWQEAGAGMRIALLLLDDLNYECRLCLHAYSPRVGVFLFTFSMVNHNKTSILIELSLLLDALAFAPGRLRLGASPPKCGMFTPILGNLIGVSRIHLYWARVLAESRDSPTTSTVIDIMYLLHRAKHNHRPVAT